MPSPAAAKNGRMSEVLEEHLAAALRFERNLPTRIAFLQHVQRMLGHRSAGRGDVCEVGGAGLSCAGDFV